MIREAISNSVKWPEEATKIELALYTLASSLVLQTLPSSNSTPADFSQTRLNSEYLILRLSNCKMLYTQFRYFSQIHKLEPKNPAPPIINIFILFFVVYTNLQIHKPKSEQLGLIYQKINS